MDTVFPAHSEQDNSLPEMNLFKQVNDIPVLNQQPQDSHTKSTHTPSDVEQDSVYHSTLNLLLLSLPLGYAIMLL